MSGSQIDFVFLQNWFVPISLSLSIAFHLCFEAYEVTMCKSKAQRLSPSATPFFPLRASCHLQPPLSLTLPPPLLRPPPPPPPPPFQPWLPAPPQTQSWVHPPVSCFSFLQFDYHSAFYCSSPPLLPPSTYVYGSTTPSAAALTAAGAKDVIEAEVVAVGEWVESGYEVTEGKENEEGSEDYYSPFFRSLPPLLSTPTYVYSSTNPYAADPAATGAKYAIEAVAERVESGFEVTEAKKNEGGLDIIGAKNGEVNGFKKRHFPGACMGLQRKFLGGQKRMQQWMPSSVHGGNNPSLLLPHKRKSDPRFGGLDRKFSESSSVMMRNIPNKLREKLIELLDKHCSEENAKIGLRSNCVLSAYDFMYVPIDFSSGVNKGYAFINFTSKAAAGRFKSFYDGYKWPLFGTRKICKIDYAKIQGREGLVWHFRDTKFPCDKEEYLPVQFSPPRNGSSQCPPPSTVGCLLGRRKDAPCQPLDEPK